MKTSLCFVAAAAALSAAGLSGAADAAVTFSFTATPSYGIEIRRHVSGQADEVTPGDTADLVSGSFTIDTLLAGANNAAAPAANYDGAGSAFLSATFRNTSFGIEPLVVTGGTATHYVDADGSDYAVLSYSNELFDADTGAFRRTTYELTGYGVSTRLLDGLLLPDFATASDLSFSIVTQIGTRDDYFQYSAAGQIATGDVSAVVPEPASWGLMILGFGLTGAALRRRRAIALAA